MVWGGVGVEEVFVLFFGFSVFFFFYAPPREARDSNWINRDMVPGFSVFRFKNSKRPILRKQQTAS
jgi:hypothetical protein